MKFKILKKINKSFFEIKKHKNLENPFLNTYIKSNFNDKYDILIYKNFYILNKIFKFIKVILNKKGKILFILPDSPFYSKLNLTFIQVLKKYNHPYINDYTKIKPGFLTNLNTSTIKKPDLVFILSTQNNMYLKNALKESFLLKIPIASLINNKNGFNLITFPIISDSKIKQVFFFYFFISNIFSKNI